MIVIPKSRVSNSKKSEDILNESPATPSLPETQITQLQSQPIYNNIVVFDWSNTLFPTHAVLTMLALHRTKSLEDDYQQLFELSQLIYLVLISYIERYKAENIHIVTSSRRGHIAESLSIVQNIGHFKDIYDILFIQNQINIINPHDVDLPFKSKDCVLNWKYSVFSSLLETSYLSDNSDVVNSFISIGDSSNEFKACKLAAKYFGNLHVHRIKFIQRPLFNEMKDQMNLLLRFVGIFELSSFRDQTNITIDYLEEKARRNR